MLGKICLFTLLVCMFCFEFIRLLILLVALCVQMFCVFVFRGPLIVKPARVCTNPFEPSFGCGGYVRLGLLTQLGVV